MGQAFKNCVVWLLSMLLMACGGVQVNPGEPPLVLIEDLEFADPALELCVAQYRHYGEPQVKWTHQVTQLECGSQYEVKSLNDMAAFPNLERLTILKLTAPKVDVSLLGSLKFLNLDGTFETLEVSSHALLEELFISSGGLQVADIENLPALKNLSVHYFGPEPRILNLKAVPRIENLYLSHLQSPAIDLHELGSLRSFQAYSVGVDNLDLSLLPKMENLELHHWISPELNLTQNPNLKRLQCISCTIGSITLTENNQLEFILISETDIEQLYIPAAKNLTQLAVQNNAALASLELPLELPKLRTALLDRNQLRELPAALWPELTLLHLQNNHLAFVSLVSMPKLLEFNAAENEMVAVDLSPVQHLWSLNLANNQIQAIDLTPVKALNDLDLSANRLNDVNLSENVDLSWLSLAENALVQVDLEKLTALEILNVAGNQLTQLDVTALVNLLDLNAARNQLHSMEIAPPVKLARLNLSENLLESLRVNPDAPLSYLDVSNNLLQVLDLSSLTLQLSFELKAQNNQLRAFVFPEQNGGVSFFYQVDLSHNQLQSLQIGLGIFILEAIFKANPLVSIEVDPTIGGTYVQSMDISQTLLDCVRARQLPTVAEVQCGESADAAAQ